MDIPAQPPSPLRRKQAMHFPIPSPIPGPNAFAQRAAAAAAASEEADSVKPSSMSPIAQDLPDTAPDCQTLDSTHFSNGDKSHQIPTRQGDAGNGVIDKRSSKATSDRSSGTATSNHSPKRQSPSARRSPNGKQTPNFSSARAKGLPGLEGSKNSDKLQRLIESDGLTKTPSSSTRIANINRIGRTPPPPPLKTDTSGKSSGGKNKAKGFFQDKFVSPNKRTFFEKLGFGSNNRPPLPPTPEPAKQPPSDVYRTPEREFPRKAAILLGTSSMGSRHVPPTPSGQAIKFGELDLAGSPDVVEDDAGAPSLENLKLRDRLPPLPPTPSSRRLEREGSEPRLLALNQRIASASGSSSGVQQNGPLATHLQYYDNEAPPTPPSKSELRSPSKVPGLDRPAINQGKENIETASRFGYGPSKGHGVVVDNMQDARSIHGVLQNGHGSPGPLPAMAYTPSIYQNPQHAQNADESPSIALPPSLGTFPAHLKARYPSMNPEPDPDPTAADDDNEKTAPQHPQHIYPKHTNPSMIHPLHRHQASNNTINTHSSPTKTLPPSNQSYETLLAQHMTSEFPSTYPHKEDAGNQRSVSGSTAAISITHFDVRLSQIHDAIWRIPEQVRSEGSAHVAERLGPLQAAVHGMRRDLNDIKAEVGQVRQLLQRFQQETAFSARASPSRRRVRSSRDGASLGWGAGSADPLGISVGFPALSPSRAGPSVDGPPEQARSAHCNQLAGSDPQSRGPRSQPAGSDAQDWRLPAATAPPQQQQDFPSQPHRETSSPRNYHYHYPSPHDRTSGDRYVYPPVKPGSHSAPVGQARYLSGGSNVGWSPAELQRQFQLRGSCPSGEAGEVRGIGGIWPRGEGGDGRGDEGRTGGGGNGKGGALGHVASMRGRFG